VVGAESRSGVGFDPFPVRNGCTICAVSRDRALGRAISEAPVQRPGEITSGRHRSGCPLAGSGGLRAIVRSPKVGGHLPAAPEVFHIMKEGHAGGFLGVETQSARLILLLTAGAGHSTTRQLTGVRSLNRGSPPIRQGPGGDSTAPGRHWDGLKAGGR